MPVTFRAVGHAGVTMFDHIARHMLETMGLAGSVPGAIQAVDVLAAHDRLRAAIESGQVAPLDRSGYGDQVYVSMKTRALPLMELLSSAAAQQHDVTWR